MCSAIVFRHFNLYPHDVAIYSRENRKEGGSHGSNVLMRTLALCGTSHRFIKAALDTNKGRISSYQRSINIALMLGVRHIGRRSVQYRMHSQFRFHSRLISKAFLPREVKKCTALVSEEKLIRPRLRLVSWSRYASKLLLLYHMKRSAWCLPKKVELQRP